MIVQKKGEGLELLTVDEVAEICKVSKVTVYRWTSSGELPTVRFGRRAIRIKPSDLEKFIEARREGATGDHL